MTASDNPHLLVVDDDARLRSLLQRYLTANGFRVTAAADALEARALMKCFAFDALILDVMMPGENGFDLAAALRETSDVPILMLTARGETEDRINGLERGADDYLLKPFEPRELMLRIGSLLRRARIPNRSPHREVRMGECLFDPERGELRRAGKPVKLTGSEAQLLKLFAANAGRAVLARPICARGCNISAGTLGRRAGDAAETQDRRRPQSPALHPDRPRRWLCPGPRPRWIVPSARPSAAPDCTRCAG